MTMPHHDIFEMGHPFYSQGITFSYFCLFDYIMQRLSIHSDSQGLSGQIPKYE